MRLPLSPFAILDVIDRRREILHEAAQKIGLSKTWPVTIFYDPIFRWPLSAVESSTGTEPRRADYVVWYLVASGAISKDEIHIPSRIRYEDLARVHTPRYLDSLSSGETLAMIFAVDAADIPVDETVNTIRIGCGATLDAARAALANGYPSISLLGGFHHAFPDKGGGLCAVNDMAVAVAVLRAEGFKGKVAVLDFDAHPPDGTAACFQGQDDVWIGSLSGSFWKPLPTVDETVLPAFCDDATYLKELEALLKRMPDADLTFVLTGGDVLASDRMGRLGLTLEGARKRDLMLAEKFQGKAAVFLPAGGYHRNAWKLLAGTVLALKEHSKTPIPARFDPMRAHYSEIWRELGIGGGEEDFELSIEDLEGSLGGGASQMRLLGVFTAEKLELIFDRIGLLRHLRRLGFTDFRVVLDEACPGERVRLFAKVAKTDAPSGDGAPGNQASSENSTGTSVEGAQGPASAEGDESRRPAASSVPVPVPAPVAAALSAVPTAVHTVISTVQAIIPGVASIGGTGSAEALDDESADGEGIPSEKQRTLAEIAGPDAEHVLMEAVLEKRRSIAGDNTLYIHWMTLRNPKATFSDKRPPLPGQEVPGLGLMREMGELFAKIAKELKLPVVSFRPAWYHMAYAAKSHFQFMDPIRQGRFEAMVRDLHKMSLREVTLAVSQKRILMNGQPFEWDPQEMGYWPSGRRQERRVVESERNRVHFTLIPLGAKRGK